MFKKLAIACAFLTVPVCGTAHEYKIGDIVVDHPMARATAVTAMAGAGYVVISNTGETADRLIGVDADFPRVMVHDTVMENDVATMVHLDGIDIGPGETVTLEPGGKHVMFMGLQGDPFEVGEKIPATLIFEKAGALAIEFNVEEIDDTMDHSAHGKE